jgi:PAS domain-containing protein
MIFDMASTLLKPAIEPDAWPAGEEMDQDRWEEMGLNLRENAEGGEQREILDALPVLVFLEHAGRIVFANAEARHMLGMGEEEWLERPVEEVLWGLFPGTAEPQTLLKRAAAAGGGHLQRIERGAARGGDCGPPGRTRARPQDTAH